MFTKFGVAVAVLLLNLQTAAPPPREIELLRSQLTLAKEKRAYLQLEAAAILVFVKGVEVERLPVSRIIGSSPGAQISRIVSRVPAVPLPKVVVNSEEVAAAVEKDTLGSVASVDEIVSVDDMPDTYMVELSDGSTWFVGSDRWDGVRNWSLKKVLQYRAAFRAARSLLTRSGGGLTVFHAEPEIARRLFWILRDDMGVIH